MDNKFLSRQKTQALIDQIGVKEADGKAFLDGLAAKGYTIEGFNDKPVQEKPSQMSRLGTDLLNRAKTVGEQIKQVGQAEGVTETVAQAAQTPLRVAGALGGAVGDVVGAGLEATKIPEFVAQPGVQQALSTTAGMIPGFSAIKQALSGVDTVTGGGIEKLKSIVTSPETQQQVSSAITKLEETQPEVAQTIKDVFNLFNLIVGGSAAKPVVKATVTGTKNAIEAVGDIAKLVPDNLSQKAVDIISSDPSAKVETILKRSTPEEVDNFLNIAKQSSVSGEAKSVFEVVGDKLSDTTKILQTKLNEIGKAKSEIMQPLREGFGAFKKETTPFIQKLNSLKNSFTEIDAASKAKVQAIINDAKNVVTKQDADVLIDKVQDALYKGGVDMTIPKGSALDKQLRGILKEYNDALKESLPKEYGQLNAQYSKLVESLDIINRSLGEVVEGVPVRGASLIKQYFSPAGSKAKEIFEFIKKETNGQVDLAKDATLAKFAGELYDDVNVSSLLGGLKSLPTTVGGIATKIVEKLGGERVSNAMRESTARKAKTKGMLQSAIDNLKDPKMRQGGYIRNPLAKKELPVQKSSSLNDITDLLSEAKKYKTAEEFVKAQQVVYHGGAGVGDMTKSIKILTPEEKLKLPSSGGGNVGLSTTSDKSYAQEYSRNIGNRSDVAKLYINPKAKVYNIGDKHIDDFTSNELEVLSKKYDVIKSNQENEFRILTDNGAVTEPQLIDIWKKGNPKMGNLQEKIDDLDGQIAELRTYDSPEDNALFDELREKRDDLQSQLEDIWKQAQGKLPKKQK